MTLFMVIQLHIVLNPTVRKLAKVTHNVGEKASMPVLAPWLTGLSTAIKRRP